VDIGNCYTFATSFENGVVAQLVEQRTENPCVTGSNPVGATNKKAEIILFQLFYFL
jgi:hypothetical protein